MKALHFRFAADILKRLGEELNPSPEQGVVELVKNAYDADARHCRVEISEVEKAGGTLRVWDDGDGMDEAAISDGWLVLGHTGKHVSKLTRLHRIPAGSKGLGRLAALRLGEKVTLKTRPRGDPSSEYVLTIVWSDFEKVGIVDEVDLEVQRQDRPQGASSGSEIIIEQLRSAFGRVEVKRLARSLVLLGDPFTENKLGFHPELVAPEYKDLEGLVKKKYFSDAEYHLSAELNSVGLSSAKVTNRRGTTIFEATHDELTSDSTKGPYASPSARLDFWAFLLKGEAFTAKTGGITATRDWLAEFGGVHVYENGLRVSPYGNPSNDWLDINLRRVQSPEERPGTNNSIGLIVVDDPRGVLQQKTDRSGFIEDSAFTELRRFAYDALEWMAHERLRVAQKRRIGERTGARRKGDKTKTKVESVIRAAPRTLRPRLRQVFATYDKAREQERATLRRDLQLYRTLSTVGVVTATFSHEASGNPIKAILNSARAIERRGRTLLGSRYDAQLRRPVEGILHSVEGMAVLASAALNLLDHERRKIGPVDVHATLQRLFAMFKPFLKAKGVVLDPQLADGNPRVEASEAAIESIVINFLTNSVAAFDRSGQKDRQIALRTTHDLRYLTLSVLDNGPGIEMPLKAIWLPGMSSKKGGTGIGLTIVQDTVADLGGKVFAIAKGDLGGAEMTVQLPIRPYLGD